MINLAPYYHIPGVLLLAKWQAAVHAAHFIVHAWAIGNFRLSSSPTGRAKFVVSYDRIINGETRGTSNQTKNPDQTSAH